MRPAILLIYLTLTFLYLSLRCEGDRDDLAKSAERQGKEGIGKYWQKKNQYSIDGFATDIVARAGLEVFSD